MQKFVVLDKQIGETPLSCMEDWRATESPALDSVPLTYAGRLDPLASGKLLVLIGEECKKKETYLSLDKEYEFEVLFGVSSDSGDVLGLTKITNNPILPRAALGSNEIKKVCKKMVGEVELPYPKFSSKPVNGKPLHTWVMEGRLNEIEIPTKESTIFKLNLLSLETKNHEEIFEYATGKIETIPPVTELRKALGNDFRRPEIRESWQKFKESKTQETYQIAKFKCVCSSGTYMRTLAEVIAKELNTLGLAYSIHRTKIGHYKKLGPFWFWINKF